LSASVGNGRVFGEFCNSRSFISNTNLQSFIPEGRNVFKCPPNSLSCFSDDSIYHRHRTEIPIFHYGERKSISRILEKDNDEIIENEVLDSQLVGTEPSIPPVWKIMDTPSNIINS
jgi:hypothetical protein